MAINSTIHKLSLQVSDMDRQHYQGYRLTLPCHPSETPERLMMRVLAFALNASERLEFANGMTDQDEPDLWEKDLTGDVLTWIQVGQPDEKAILRACGKARLVRIYAYNLQPLLWWEKIAPKLQKARNLECFMAAPVSVKALAALASKSMDLQVSVQDGDASFFSDSGSADIVIRRLQVR